MTRRELAEAMIRGIETPGVLESDCDYVSKDKKKGLCRTCALGAALIGKCNGDSDEAAAMWRAAHEVRTEDGPIAAMADMLSISDSLAEEVELKHCDGETIRQIAAWLKEGENEETDRH